MIDFQLEADGYYIKKPNSIYSHILISMHKIQLYWLWKQDVQKALHAQCHSPHQQLSVPYYDFHKATKIMKPSPSEVFIIVYT